MERRSFLVSVLGSVVGKFILPLFKGITGGKSKTASRKLLTKPVKQTQGDSFFLLFVEEFPDGSTQLMTWVPESTEECEEAERFYQACRGIGSDADPKKRLKSDQCVYRSEEEKNYLRAIIDSGYSNETFLAYAGWLIERKESLGEFIKVCVEIQQAEEGSPRWSNLRKRWSSLRESHEDTWGQPLEELGLTPEFWLYDRGMVEIITIDGPGILPKRVEQLFAAAPLIRSIDLLDESVKLASIVDLPQMRQIEELTVGHYEAKPKDVVALAESKCFPRLKELNLSLSPVGPQAGISLSKSPILKQLEILELDSCKLKDAGVLPLVGSKSCINLKELNLAGNDISEEGTLAVIRSPHFKALTELKLGGNRVGLAGAKAFRNAAFLKSLLTLDLKSSGLDSDWMSEFAKAEFEELETLILSLNPIQAGGLRSLLNAPYFGKLYELQLGYCDLGDEGAIAFSERNQPGIIILGLFENGITDRGILSICGSQAFTSVSELNLYGNPITLRGIEALANAGAFPDLQKLDLREIELGAAGCQLIADGKAFKNLEWLMLSAEGMGKKGKKILLDRFGEDVVQIV